MLKFVAAVFGILLMTAYLALFGNDEVALVAATVTLGVLYFGLWALLRGFRHVFGDPESVLARERDPL